jgi:hypothetical protein
MVSVPDIRYLYHHLFYILSFHSSFYCSLVTIYLTPLFILPPYYIFTINHITYSQSLLSHSTESKSYIYLYFILLLILFPIVISTYNRSVFPLQYSRFYCTQLRLYLLTIAYHTCVSLGKLLLVVHNHALQVYKLGCSCEYTSVLYPRNYPAKVNT